MQHLISGVIYISTLWKTSLLVALLSLQFWHKCQKQFCESESLYNQRKQRRFAAWTKQKKKESNNNSGGRVDQLDRLEPLFLWRSICRYTAESRTNASENTGAIVVVAAVNYVSDTPPGILTATVSRKQSEEQDWRRNVCDMSDSEVRRLFVLHTDDEIKQHIPGMAGGAKRLQDDWRSGCKSNKSNVMSKLTTQAKEISPKLRTAVCTQCLNVSSQTLSVHKGGINILFAAYY